MQRRRSYGAALFLWWSRRIARFSLVAVGTLVLLAYVAPDRMDDPEGFRADYVRAPQRYERTTYVWGGETRLGIDCSGLMRATYVDTCYNRALRTLNPQPLRDGLSMRYHDRSVRAIGEEDRGECRQMFPASSIYTFDHSRLLSGDMAVPGGGVRIMAYLGGNEWIEADPKPVRAVRVRPPDKSVGWFGMHATFVRWSRFYQTAGAASVSGRMVE